MFDALRRAEAERLRGRTAGGAERSSDHDARTVAREAPAVLTNRLGAMGASVEALPEGLVRELGILRNSVETILNKPAHRSIMFTSASHGEGTTTLALGYARLLAAGGGERVLFVEGNARRPSLARRFGFGDVPGFVECVAGKCVLSTVVLHVDAMGIDAVPVGRSDPADLQLHMDTGVPRVLEECVAGWDTVVIDTPPVIISPETPQLAARADGVVMVLRAGHTKYEVAQRALEMLSNVGGKTLGIALNRKRYYIPEFIYERI